MYSSIIATVAIILTIINLILLYNHNKKTLKPYLLINTDIETNEGFIEIYLINKGVGPAIISDFRLSYKGNSIDTSNYKYLIGKIDQLALRIAKEKDLPEPLEVRRSLREIENNRTVLAANERIRFLRVEPEHFKLVTELMSNVEIDCEYKSIYDEKERVDYKSGIK